VLDVEGIVEADALRVAGGVAIAVVFLLAHALARAPAGAAGGAAASAGGFLVRGVRVVVLFLDHPEVGKGLELARRRAGIEKRCTYLYIYIEREMYI
jgi:hypothetical protein